MSIYVPHRINNSEDNSFVYECDINLLDNSGNPITGSVLPNINTLTLTLINASDSSVINSRSAQNVLNANNVTVDDDGHLTWVGQAADSPIVTSSRKGDEVHIATFRCRYGASLKALNWDVYIFVRNLGKAF